MRSLLNRDEDHRSCGLSGRLSIQPRTANGWCGCRRLGCGLPDAVSVPAERLSIFAGNAEAAGRYGLGLFLQPRRCPGRCIATPRTAIRSITCRPHLLKGMDDNYAWMGKHWPDSRYVVISLSFDAQGEDKPLPWIEGWRCVFDIENRAHFQFPPISPTTTPRRSSPRGPNGDKRRQNRGRSGRRQTARNRRQNAGIDGQNQYVAARNRLDGRRTPMSGSVPRPEIQEKQL